MPTVAKRYYETLYYVMTRHQTNIPTRKDDFVAIFYINFYSFFLFSKVLSLAEAKNDESLWFQDYSSIWKLFLTNNWIEVQGTRHFQTEPKLKWSKETILNRKRNEFSYNVTVHGYCDSFLFTFGLILRHGLMHSDLSKVLELYSTHRQQVCVISTWFQPWSTPSDHDLGSPGMNRS